MTSTAGRKLIRRTRAVLLAGLLGACANAAEVSGRPPENATREDPNWIGAKKTPDRAARLAAREEKEPTGPRVEKVDPKEARIGVASTHRFHRPECPLLK